MDGHEFNSLGSAIQDFHRARNQANLKVIISRFTGKNTELLSFDDVRKKLKAQGSAEKGLRDIPLDAIIGSLGRYNDFTRDFLPRKDTIAERWARVKMMTNGMTGLPPIDVYKIGEVYFVKDGNHRVSVARELGAQSISAYVTEVLTRVPLTPDVSPDDLILKEEYVNFLENTHLDLLRPEADLSVTIPGQYPVLEEHISVHRYFMGIDQKRPIPYEEAVAHWYDSVYLPMVDAIRERGLLHHFPARTEADMYLWIAENHAALVKQLGWDIKPESTVHVLAGDFSRRSRNLLVRFSEAILEFVTQGKFIGGPPTGEWRREVITTHTDKGIFPEILVPVDGSPTGWHALDQALIIAKREGAQLNGLHIVEDEAYYESDEVTAIQEQYNQKCKSANIPGKLAVAAGETAPLIAARAVFADLVVITLNYPPEPQPLARLESGFRTLILQCPRPILAIPRTITPMQRGLLAYDGSPKADEALFVATYLAGKWNIPLVVLTVQSGSISSAQYISSKAKTYLKEHGVQARCLLASEPFSTAISRVAREEQIDFYIMGGYGYNPVVEMVLGSAVDQVLRESDKPVLICR